MFHPTAVDGGWLSPSFHSPELKWRISPQLELTEVDRSYQSLEPADLRRRGYPFLRGLLSGEQPALLDDALKRVLQRGATIPVLETSTRHPVSGETVHFISALSPLYPRPAGRKRSGQPVAVQVLTRDVTMIREVERARDRRVHELAGLGYMTARLGKARSVKELLRRVMHGTLDVVGACIACLVVSHRGHTYRLCTPASPAAFRLLRWSSTQQTRFGDTEELRFASPPPELEGDFKINDLLSIAALPVRVNGVHVGLMTLSCPSEPDKLARHTTEMSFSVHLLDLILMALTDMEEGQQTLAHGQLPGSFVRTFSQGKLVVVSAAEMHALEREAAAGVECGTVPVQNTDALPRVRRLVEQTATAAGCDEDQTADLALCCTEASTNVLVHGSEGRVTIYRLAHELQFWIRDQGKGIDLVGLARSALFRNWSSRASMGLGFSLMLELTDRVTVHTSPQGTTLILHSTLKGPPSV